MNQIHTATRLPHLATVNGATRLIVGGQPVLLLGGELHNSSASSLDYMEREVWGRIEALNCNMILPTISWELVEPEEGRFDFSLVDGLIEQARDHNVFLVPLWFGAYKNAQSNYAPAWVKRDLARFPRAEATPGTRIETVSVLSRELRYADAKAFAAVMRRIRELDPEGTTVVMMQVENEVGLLRGSRDHCALAREAYESDVPTALISYLSLHRDTLQPGLRTLWDTNGAREHGAWRDVFGDGWQGDEVFMAWHFAQYCGAVGAAGIAEHPIPMYANAWLVQNDGQPAGDYPSGGPVASMIDIWRAAAPNMAFLAPDIYLPDFAAECARYTVSGNPLFIPEMTRGLAAAASALYAVGEHAAIGVAPFGIDSIGVADLAPAIIAPEDAGNPVVAIVAGAHSQSSGSGPSAAKLLQTTYRLLGDMAPVLQGVDAANVRGVIENATVDVSPDMIVDLGGYRILVQWANPGKPRDAKLYHENPFVCGGGIIALVEPGVFVIAGFGFRVRFSCPDEPGSVVEYLSIDDGDYCDGKWMAGRRLNGDEYRIDLLLGADGAPSVRRVVPYTYASRV
ncbi:MAG TPA: DUF5597 domain-containing protein [Capsulimonadaceae bacterium]|jgi:hypothetical protein